MKINFAAIIILAMLLVSMTGLTLRTRYNGTVKWYNSTKGYGFISPEDGSRDVYVQKSAVNVAGLVGLN